ncbi:uncharacterized protein KIAA1958-like [Mytilus edulis]|uniref:uncharacterized protein KIAA1958-like n=1 Tax=Mytilus edulis TaxID=6550 RepID=UPI0039EE47C3
MATNKNDAFEDQSNRHFLHQFGGNSAHESQSQTDDDAIWESEEDTNERLSEMNSPCCNYWDFSKPRSIERYKNLPVNIQSNQITQKQQDDNVHSEKEIEDIAAKNVNKKQATTTSTLTDHQRFRDVTDAELESFIKEQESKNTCRKTKSDLNIFQSYLKTKHNDTRKIDEIPPHEYATKERQTNGTMEYEPTPLKSIQQSISRYLKDSNYQCNIMTDDEFYKSRQTFSAKFKNLKSLRLGNKPNAADPITDDDINKFYSKNVMGATSPRSLINTKHINNNYHFGLRGVTEHYNLCWGDITLKVDTNGDEYLQYCRERQTKTRQGDNLSNLRKTGPIAMENKNDHSRCPVFAYKLYRQKRPETMKKDYSPFYIQATTFLDDTYGSKLLWYKAQRFGTKSI